MWRSQGLVMRCRPRGYERWCYLVLGVRCPPGLVRWCSLALGMRWHPERVNWVLIDIHTAGKEDLDN